MPDNEVPEFSRERVEQMFYTLLWIGEHGAHRDRTIALAAADGIACDKCMVEFLDPVQEYQARGWRRYVDRKDSEKAYWRCPNCEFKVRQSGKALESATDKSWYTKNT